MSNFFIDDEKTARAVDVVLQENAGNGMDGVRKQSGSVERKRKRKGHILRTKTRLFNFL